VIWFITPPPIGERSIVMSVFVCVCVSVRGHVVGTARPIFTTFFVHVTYGRASVLLWRHSDMLCASGLWMTLCLLVSQGCSTSPPSWSAAHMQPWAWLETVHSNSSCRPTDAWDYFSGAYSCFPGGNTGGRVCSLLLCMWELLCAGVDCYLRVLCQSTDCSPCVV